MNKVISSFDWIFALPNNDFSKTVEKSLKINFVDGKDGWNKGFYFEVDIPDYLYDFVRDKHPDYSDSIGDDAFKTPVKFRHFIRTQSFSDLKLGLEQMSTRALFFKKLSLMNEFDKVIFIKCKYSMAHIRDNYNFADMNNKYDLSFNYFVAYEIEEDDFIKGSRYKAYYGLNRIGEQHLRMSNDRMLPLIHVTDLSQYVMIRWTQEREDFLEDTARKIGKVSSMIDEYVKKIDDNTFDEIIDKSIKNKFLEYHGGEQ
jgi:hypothetical protein